MQSPYPIYPEIDSYTVQATHLNQHSRIFPLSFGIGDALPLGLPSLMMSPQDSPLGTISAEEIARRDAKWNTNTPHASVKRAEYIEPSKSGLDPAADQWKTTNSGWALELKKVPYPEA